MTKPNEHEFTGLATFKQYLQLADKLTQVASKDDVAECASF